MHERRRTDVKELKELPAAVLVARYLRAVGWSGFQNRGFSHPPIGRRYGTRDGYVPFGVFFEIVGALNPLEEREELRLVDAQNLSAALWEQGKDHKVKRQYRELRERAFPERRVDD